MCIYNYIYLWTGVSSYVDHMNTCFDEYSLDVIVRSSILKNTNPLFNAILLDQYGQITLQYNPLDGRQAGSAQCWSAIDCVGI